MPFHRASLALLLVALQSATFGSTTPKALLLCYPVDDLIKRACQQIERTLSQCESGPIEVIRLDAATPETLDQFLRAQKPPLPSHVPVFGVGHGGTDLTGAHYIAQRKFWSDATGPVTSESFKDPKNTVNTALLNEVLDARLEAPSKWYMSCHSGGTCKKGSNVGASCKSWETTNLTVRDPLKDAFGINLKLARQVSPLDTTTRTLLRLLCDKEAFASADTNQDNSLTQNELRKELQEDFDVSESCPSFRLKNKEQQEEVMQLIKSQLATTGAEIRRQELVQDPKTQETILKVHLCQPDCIKIGKKAYSPRLEFFSLPSPSLQKSTEPLIPHAGPKEDTPSREDRRSH